ncbi:MAG TPA: hypothetical protein VHL98_13095 [Microvirga sp.]|jgi:hypothetical protein|nr:hypothetical protein [Microvirga sp.]
MRFARFGCAAAALVLAAAPASAQPAAQRAGSFPLHEENGRATLVEQTGLGSASARMVGEFTSHDIKEMCERIGWKFYSPSFPFHGNVQDNQTITLCRKSQEERPLQARRYEVRANCPEAVLHSPMGYTFRRVDGEWRTLSGRPVSGEFTPGHADVVAKQFAMLCSGLRT